MRTFGIERERFIVNPEGKIVPAIGRLLPRIYQIAKQEKISKKLFSFELFAGQVEDRTPPCENMKTIKDALEINNSIMVKAVDEFGLSFDHSEFVEEKRVTLFEVNPFSERHQKIWNSISHERKVSASIVAAVHVHISVNDREAVRVINLCRKDVIDSLICIGDHSDFRRINAYRTMAETDGVPPIFSTFSELMEYIASKGGEKNVWDLVRFKPSTGTIEFRMFGATPSIKEIIGYIQACRDVSKI